MLLPCNRAINPFPWRDRTYNGKFKIPTFQEYVQVATNKRNPKVVCIYPETKHPTFFNKHPVLRAARTTIDDLLIQELKKLGYNVQVKLFIFFVNIAIKLFLLLSAALTSLAILQ